MVVLDQIEITGRNPKLARQMGLRHALPASGGADLRTNR